MFVQYAVEKYQVDVGGVNQFQLNRAIAKGTETGIFVLPKGLSGKVKLAPKTKAPGASKEVRGLVCCGSRVDRNVAEFQAALEISQQQEDGCWDQAKCAQEDAGGETQGSCRDKEGNNDT